MSSGAEAEVALTVEGDDVVVHGPSLLTNRLARMFFGSIVGGQQTPTGWRCPVRRQSKSVVVVKINTFLESKGWTVKRTGIIDEAVQREIERKRSFQRAKNAATDFRRGQGQIPIEHVKKTLSEFGWNDHTRALRSHQEQGVVHALHAVNAANFSVPGSGKTAIGLALAATHLANKTIDVVLVVGPLACFAPWEKEAKAALGDRISPRRIRGAVEKRSALYAGVRPGTLVLVSFATAAADRVRLIEMCERYRVMLVVDESHRVKRFRGGLWAPALVDLAKHSRLRLILSGTPMPQHGRDLFSQLNILWPSGELTGPRDHFAARVDRDFPSLLKELQPFLARTPKEALGLRPYELQYHKVPLSGTQADIYSLIEAQFRRHVQGAETWKDKIEALKRARPIRLLQAAANPDLLNRKDHYYKLPVVEHSSPTLMDRLSRYTSENIPAKSAAALALIRDLLARGEKVVCWSNFVPNLDQFSQLVRERLELPCFQIDGRVATAEESEDPLQPLNPTDVETRERIIENFLSLPKPAVLVTNPASCSESISLHRSCHNAIYLDRTYDCALFLQSIDRIHRLGLPPDVTVRVHILQATIDDQPTIDGLVDQSLRAKHDRMRQLLEGAELRPIELSDDPLADAEGDSDDLSALLRFLLGEEA